MTETEIIEGEIIEEARLLPAVLAHDAVVARAEITVEDVVAQKDKILAVQKAVMRDTVHYGKIPGISKPSLFKPGAEVLCTTFRFAPSYVRNIEWVEMPRDDGGVQRHMLVTVDCTLTHSPSGVVLGSAGGFGTTMESKYAYRQKGKECLTCGAELRKSKRGKSEWYCWEKTGGCGATFEIDNPSIEAQVVGRKDNPDLADTYNTVLKMADKRALVAAILVCTAASEIFTQDVEDNAQTAVSEATGSRTGSSGETAKGGALQKMRLDIQDLLRTLDKKRKVDAGTTFAEMQEQVKLWFEEAAWDEIDEEKTAHVGQRLGAYYAYMLEAQRQKVAVKTFGEWVANDEVPF